MKLIRNKVVSGILCILIGLTVGFVVLPQVSEMQNEEMTAVRMTVDADAGAKINSEMVEEVTIPKGIIDNSISAASLAVGKYTTIDLCEGDYLSLQKLTDTLDRTDAFSAGTEKGKLVVSITLPSLASGVSGRLLPGDIVTVMVVPESKTAMNLSIEPNDITGEQAAESAPTIIYPELRYLEVCMAITGDGTDSSVESELDEDEKNSLPVTVSFYANQEQALRLAELEHENTIYLAFVARGDNAAKFISDADRVLNTEER